MTRLLALAGVLFCSGTAGAVSITPRSDHTATLLPDRTILVVGGLNAANTPMTSVQLLTDTRGTNLTAMLVARASHTATLLPNGEVLVTGGQINLGGTITDDAVVFNPVQNCWHNGFVRDMSSPRIGHTATLMRTGPYAGSVLICGGRQTAGVGVAGDYEADCDIFQPVTTPAASLSCAASPGDFAVVHPAIQQPRAFHTATMLPDGRVFFAGGYAPTATPVPYTSTAEVYDPPRGIFISAYPLSQGRAFHTATLMGDGKVFIAGGFDGQDVADNAEVSGEPFASMNRGLLRSTEIYDPVGDHTSFAGTMIERKMMHATTLENNGQMIAWGGLGNLLNSYQSAASFQIRSGNVSVTCPARTIATTNFNIRTMYKLLPYNAIPTYLVTPNPSGVIEKGALYMTIDPEDDDAENPSIGFTGGTLLFDPADPDAAAGLQGSLAGARVTCPEADDCGWIDRRTDYLNIVNGAGMAEFSAPAVTLNVADVTAGNVTFPAFPDPTTSGTSANLTPSNLTVNLAISGFPPQVIGANLSGVNLTIRGVSFSYTYPASGEQVYTFTLGFMQILNMNTSIPVAADPVTGTGLATFNGVTLPITALPGVNTVSVSSTTSFLPAVPNGSVSAVGEDLSSGQATVLANYCADNVALAPIGGTYLDLDVNLGVSIVDRMIFGDVEVFRPGGASPLTWRYTGHGPSGARFRHTMTLTSGGTPEFIGGVSCDPDQWDASCPIIPVPNSNFTLSTGAFIVISEDGFTMESGAMGDNRANHTATTLPDGTILVSGGSNGPNILDRAELFNPTTKTFSPTAGRMHETRSLHTANLLPNGRVLVAGGYSTNATSTGAIAGAEIYYPDVKLWRSSSTMSSARNNHTATLLPDGNVLVVGGYANGQYLATAEIYYSTIQAWAPVNNTNLSARALHTATLLRDGRVMIAGGQNASGVVNTYQFFNPTLGTWSAPAFINPGGTNVSVRYHTASLLADGQVLVAGGNDGSWETSRVMTFDPASGAWRNVRPLPLARERHTATLLPNGNVAVIGGAQAVAYGGQPNASVEIYDPTTGNWSEWEGGMTINEVEYSLPVPRAYHTTTLGPNGNLLVIGGSNGSAMVNTVLSHFHMAAPHDSNSTGGQPSTRLSSVTATDLSPFERGERLTVTGRNFLGVTEGSGGGAASANSDQRHPILTLQAIDGSGGNSSQGDSGYILDLTTRIYESSNVNSWSVINDSITLILPGAPLTVPPPVGSASALLPYGWYRLHTGANDQFSASYMVHAGPHLPSTPVTGLDVYPAAAGVGVSSVTYSWVAPAGLVPGTDFNGYNVYTSSTGVFLTTVSYAATSVTFNNLPASSAQQVVVQPYNLSGDYPTLTPSATVYTLPLDPAHVELATAPGNTFYVKWDTYSVETGTGNFAGTLYEVSQSTSLTFSPVLAVFPPTTSNFAPATPLQLTPNTRYYFRVKACNLHGSPYGECSGYGQERDSGNRYVSTQTLTAVSGVYGVAYATDTINWYWTAAGGGALYQVVNATVPFGGAGYVVASNVSTNSYSMTGLPQNQRKVIQVQVQDGVVVGPLSVSATAYSLAMPPVWTANSCPASPLGITTGSVVVSWNTQPNGLGSGGAGPEDNLTTYEVQYATSNWDRATGAWTTNTWLQATVTNIDRSLISHSLILENINHAVPLYARARALNTDGDFLDRTVNTTFTDPTISPYGGWINLISNTDDDAYTSTLQRPPTALMIIDPKGSTSATLWWMDQSQWVPPSNRLGYPQLSYQVVMTTCAWYEGPTLRVDFSHSSGPYCGVTPSGANYSDLPFNTNQALITNLNTWSTYYFTLDSINLPHYDNNNPIAQTTIPVAAAPPYVSYYTNVPGAVAGSLVVDVSARYGGGISSATVGVEAPGQVQHTVSFLAPPESFPIDTRVTISTFSVENDARIAHCPGAGGLGPGMGGTLCGGDNNLAFEITADPAVQPRLPLFFTVYYKGGEPVVPGMTDPTQAILMRFDLDSCKCVPLRSPTAPSGQSITAQLNHLSIFQVATVNPSGSPANMRIYPNPYYTSRDGWLTIDRVPANARVRLFTMRGEMVADSTADSHGIFTWQGANRGGRYVASGIYLVVVEGNGIKAIRKVVLLR